MSRFAGSEHIRRSVSEEHYSPRTERLEGNLFGARKSYITASNMAYFSAELLNVPEPEAILLTPYLIVEDVITYELHYYEFDIEVRGEKSYYTDYNKRNALPAEITQKLKPQAIVAVGDVKFYSEVVKNYLTNMQTMEFASIKEHYPQLKMPNCFIKYLPARIYYDFCKMWSVDKTIIF